jgi:DNA primase small subunit
VFSWAVFNKTLLQRVPRSAPVIDCMELDGSLPVSTSNANLHRYDVASASASSSNGRPAPSRPQAVASYWRDVFPFDVLWHLAPGHAESAREFCFVFPQNRWTPARFFRTAVDLRVAAVHLCPAQIHVGLVRAPVPVNPTLAFDVDVNDYAAFRPCCKREGTACERCWPILEFAQLALAAFLREYGMADDVLFFFSGSKGVHAWVAPTNANAKRVACSTLARATLADDFASVYQVPRPAGAAGAATAEYAIPDFPAATQLRAFTQAVLGSSEARARWRAFVCDDMGLADAFGRHESRHGTESALAHVLWPRIDAAVTRDSRHKIKAPYSVHARTERVAVWLPTPDVNPFSAAHAAILDPETNVRALRTRLGLPEPGDVTHTV